MGSRLTSLLVQEGFITLEALKDALALQVIRGGQLDTILLEKKLCDEPMLLGLLGRATGYPPVEPAAMSALDPAAATVISLEAAKRLDVCPVSSNDEGVVLLVGAGADPVHLEELAFDLGKRLSPLASTEVRLLQARQRVYGIDLLPRHQRLLEKLGDLPAPAEVQLAEGVASLPVLTPHIQPRRRRPSAPLTPAAPEAAPAPAAEPAPVPAAAAPFKALLDSAREAEAEDGYQVLEPLGPAAAALPEEPPELPKDITDEFPPVRPVEQAEPAVAGMPPIPPDAVHEEPARAEAEVVVPDEELLPEQTHADLLAATLPDLSQHAPAPPTEEAPAEPAEPPAAAPQPAPAAPLAREASDPDAIAIEAEPPDSSARQALPSFDAPAAPDEVSVDAMVPEGEQRFPSGVFKTASAAISSVASGELRTPTPARPAPVPEKHSVVVEELPERVAPPTEKASFTEATTVRLPLARQAPPRGPEAAQPAAGPLSLEEAFTAMARAGDRDQVLLALARGAHSLLECVQIYVMRRDQLQGHLEVVGAEADFSQIRTRRLSLELPSVVSRAVADGAIFIGPAPDTDSSPSVLISAGVLALRGVCLVPVTLRGKTVCLLAAHSYDQPLSQRLRGPLTRLAEEASAALAGVILRQKAEPPPKPAQIAPEAEGTTQKYSTVSLQPSPAQPAPSEPGPAPKPARSEAVTVPDRSSPPVDPSWTEAPTGPGRAWDAAPAAPAARAAVDWTEAPTGDLPAAPAPRGAGEWTETPTAEMPVRPRGRVVPPSGYSFDSVEGHQTIPDLSAAAAAALHMEQEALSRVPALLAVLEAGGSQASDAEAELVRLGSPALNLLINQFPGWLRIDRAAVQRDLPPVWECSAVLRAILAFGRQAIPALAPLFRNRDAQVRFFVCYLMSELVYPEGVALLAAGLQDPDAGVRWVAAHVLWRFKELEQFPEVLLDLRADLSNPDPRPRRAAADALAALGDSDSVPALVALLEDPVPAVSEAAYGALVALTKQDFALNTGKWLTWWEANRTRPRLLWLVDGLLHATPEIRASAATDLEELTGLTFGYRYDLSQGEREAARRRFLEWWAEAGRFRFARG